MKKIPHNIGNAVSASYYGIRPKVLSILDFGSTLECMVDKYSVLHAAVDSVLFALDIETFWLDKIISSLIESI